jgi:FKBP-type peptidyl-prolyl cis-trans isomerase
MRMTLLRDFWIISFGILLTRHTFSFRTTFKPLIFSPEDIKKFDNTASRLAYSNSFTKKVASSTLLHAILDNSIDITATTDGGILKRSKRKGNPTKGHPQAKDVVEIAWKIYHANGTLAHDSSGLSEPFSFTVGADPRHVLLGWETAVKGMYEGEVALFTLQPEYAFGAAGAPPLFIAPNVTIDCELEILKVRPSVNRVYQSVGFDESIKDELMDKIHSGESVVSSEVMANKRINATKTDVKHKLDPNQIVKGQGENHIWEETPRTMDVEIPLPSDRLYSKQDIVVKILSSEMSIALQSGEVLMNGPLGGRVNPSESMWALLEPDHMSQFVGKQRIVVSLEKRFCSQEIWATVLSRDFLGDIEPLFEEEEVV